MNILVLNGPNLNLLGTREPDLYGHTTLAQINESLEKQAVAAGAKISFLQSNAEADLITSIHDAAQTGVNRIIFNPGAFTHTSVALRDALLGVGIPFYEVHLSNTHAREDFRQKSYFSDVAAGVLIGLGPDGYRFALEAALGASNH